MEINAIPDVFQSKIRLAIVASLMTGEKSFSDLKHATCTSDGNLSVHISKLEKAGYTESNKGFFNNKPKTTYRLTAKGEKIFIDYVTMLEEIIAQASDDFGSM